jgi:hypothetical protein
MNATGRVTAALAPADGASHDVLGDDDREAVADRSSGRGTPSSFAEACAELLPDTGAEATIRGRPHSYTPVLPSDSRKPRPARQPFPNRADGAHRIVKALV